MVSYYFSSYGEVFGLFHRVSLRSPLEAISKKVSVQLSSLQNEALNYLKRKEAATLFGETGSGKTEIYIKLIEEVIHKEKTVIYLLPEIAITSQIEKRIKKEFGDLVAIWHSKITKKKKEEILEKVAQGEVRIIVGARSALFITMPNLGLIIVDESHDDSYKSQSGVRYHAKDMAIFFSKTVHIPAVLGSATPLVSDLHKLPYFRLNQTFYKSKKYFSYVESFDQVILSKIAKTLSRKKQIILFIPTRANFKYMICKSCNHVITCPFCEVGMSLHTSSRAMKCHYCNYVSPIPKVCLECGEESFINKRMGSSEVVEMLQNEFLDAVIEKFDRDMMISKTRIDKVLKRFNDNEIDILVGTQMLSKGHNYHDVELAVILDIDYIFAMPDFRARERALALAYQVAGRAGRREDGEVIIQTKNPEFFSQTYESFVNEELEFRKELEYPPFARVIKIEFSNKDELKAKNRMEKVYRCLKEKANIIGYGESPIKKISNKYRYQILIKGNNLHLSIRPCLIEGAKVDMDAVNLI